MDLHLKHLLESEGYSCVIQPENGALFTSKKSGIAPLMDFIDNSKTGVLAAADKVIGKSAALLFVKMGAKCIYGCVMSRHAESVFRSAGEEYSYGQLVPYIVNRQGDGMCPMEETVLDTDDPEIAYRLLCAKLKELRQR